jgi:hypothetical protein
MLRVKAMAPVLRLAFAILIAAGISAGLTAKDASRLCEIDCGDGCQIQVEDCVNCLPDEQNCTIYFFESCEFYCTAQCEVCEVFEN